MIQKAIKHIDANSYCCYHMYDSIFCLGFDFFLTIIIFLCIFASSDISCLEFVALTSLWEAIKQKYKDQYDMDSPKSKSIAIFQFTMMDQYTQFTMLTLTKKQTQGWKKKSNHVFAFVDVQVEIEVFNECFQFLCAQVPYMMENLFFQREMIF